MDPNKLKALNENSQNGVVYVVGGAGYIGSRLVPRLVQEGWGVVVIDNLIYGQPAPTDTDHVVFLNEDVLSLDVPAGNEPVIWLASMHRDLPEKEDFEKQGERYTTLMIRRPLGWSECHPLVYASSASVLTDRTSLYSIVKALAEETIMQVTRRFQIYRFGTVWGSLDLDPARPQTAINRALVGTLPDEHYGAYITHMDAAVETLTFSLYRDFLGTIENAFTPDLVTRKTLEGLEGVHTVLGLKFKAEKARLTPARIKELEAMEHPCEAIRRFYWPALKVVEGGEDASEA